MATPNQQTHHPRPTPPKKLSTKQEDVDGEEISTRIFSTNRARLRLLAPLDKSEALPVDNFEALPVDTFRSTHKLLRSAGCRQPLAFLARFKLQDIVFWLDAMAGEMAAGSDIFNPPGYLWRLLENAEAQEAPHDPQ